MILPTPSLTILLPPILIRNTFRVINIRQGLILLKDPLLLNSIVSFQLNESWHQRINLTVKYENEKNDYKVSTPHSVPEHDKTNGTP